MRAAIAVKHHDHDYVEKRGGWELYTHLRAAPSRVRARREAIDRAGQLYEAAVTEGVSADARNGRALIVLQRTLVALEDLGGLLHAFRGSDPWNRLRNARYDELDEAFEAAASDPDVVITRLGLADRETLTAEGLPADQAAAFWRLREITAERWRRGLQTSSSRWLAQRVVAKATMHGFPIVSGPQLIGPPGAGEIAENVPLPKTNEFVMALVSTVQANRVATQQWIVELDEPEVQATRREGRAAARLYGELCEMQAQTIEMGCAASVPLRPTRWLSAADQALVETALKTRQETRGDAG